MVMMTFGLMHGWVDQFAIEPMSLFIQNNGQILEIITILH
jgi:hypothetical protein